jgi:hypothetical protein
MTRNPFATGREPPLKIPQTSESYATKSYDIGQDDGVERAGEGSSEEVTRRLDRFEKQAPAREK